MFENEGIVVVSESRDVRRATPMSPCRDLPDVGCGDVFIGPLSFSLPVTILTGKTLDSAVMTTRAEKYH
jgi:hypothetical protein